jgi:hypothetical protein
MNAKKVKYKLVFKSFLFPHPTSFSLVLYIFSSYIKKHILINKLMNMDVNSKFAT